MLIRLLSITALLIASNDAFVVQHTSNLPSVRLAAESAQTATPEAPTTSADEISEKRRLAKAALFGLIGTNSAPVSSSSIENTDPVLADPVTKGSLVISTTGTLLGGIDSSSGGGAKVLLTSEDNVYTGRKNTYYNLLRKQEDDVVEEGSEEGEEGKKVISSALNSLQMFIPPPLRPVLASSGLLPKQYIPMRDLFTSPSVSFAYERGWRQGFASAGFPGADKEYEMVKEFFIPMNPKTVVDMSCATGLFTRRLAKGGDFDRVIGCDYSEAMLLEARNRISSDPDLGGDSIKTKLDLVRCDVGEIPMKTGSVDALHAGAAMHCWPDLDSAMSEINRVVKPGGRFFASTFLAPYFRTVQTASGDGIEQQAFQYFESVEDLKEIIMRGGFKESEVDIEVLGVACAIIRVKKDE